MGSAVLGVIATLVIGHGPGSVLGLFIVAGTVVAALAIRPTAVRMLLPVPALCYVIAALATGLITDPPSDTSKAALAVAAAQWIAAGFLTMVLATVLAVALTVVRWLLWRRSRPVPDGPVRSAQSGSRRKRPVSREDFEDPEPYGSYGTPVSLGNPGAIGNYGNYGTQAGMASPGLRNADGFGDTGGPAGQGRFGSPGGVAGQGDFRNTGGGAAGQGRLGNPGGLAGQGDFGNPGGGLAGQGRFGDVGGRGGQGDFGSTTGLGGAYGETGGLGGQGGYGDAAGQGPVGRAGRWGDPGAPDPGGPGSWPDALTSAAQGRGRRP